MQLVDEHTVIDYLRDAGVLSRNEMARAEALAGGVSNVVLRIAFDDPARADWVLKQARGQLRVADPWYCPVERIWREVDTLRLCAECVDQAPSDDAGGIVCVIPDVVFEDRANYVYAMTAAPPDHTVWKQQLLAGATNRDVARACGRLLAALHATTWGSVNVATELGDRTFFEQLRVDPYYRHVARHYDEFRPWLEALIESTDANLHCLVHGDFSPKNLLLFDRRVMLVDFEVGHFGDPAFDLGFFLTHLVLKSIHAVPARSPEYWQLGTNFLNTYETAMRPRIGDDAFASLTQRATRHVAGCLIARIDGKSKVEYLNDAESRKSVRNLSRRLFRVSLDWSDVIREET